MTVNQLTSDALVFFGALRISVDNWRWQGVPFYIRAGKSLATTCTEIMVRLRRPPRVLPVEPSANYMRIRLSPQTQVAIGLNVMDRAERGEGQMVELLASRHSGATESNGYPVVKAATAHHPYEPGSWGPAEAADIAPPGGWREPSPVTWNAVAFPRT